MNRIFIVSMKQSHDFNAILTNLPQIQAGKGLWQNEYHAYDVFDHTMEFVKHVQALTKDPDIIAAGYLHDIGKPVVAKRKYKLWKLQSKEPGKPYHTFRNHEIVGEKMVRKMDPEIFKKLGLNQDRVASLVGCHYLPMRGIKEMRKARTFNNFLKKFHTLEKTLENSKVSKQDILTMFLADKLAQGASCSDQEELFLIRDALLGKEVAMQKIYELERRNSYLF